jgi:hypothetical protein
MGGSQSQKLKIKTQIQSNQNQMWKLTLFWELSTSMPSATLQTG